ncbi:hypothetical protein MRB53_011381 [Persea americana]|uniref:Uncharacterized protein n=1 Tax=Persea americana TaxID=3435 RepID=A0ACC2LUV3_PERAE|nr:hypothetical protein MRB53_011381 [Persea americana]
MRGMDMLFLIALVAVFTNGIVLGSRSMDDREIKRQLKLLNKPAVKTIKSEDGDIVDCVDIYKQPSLDHPLLKNHTIQMRPSIIPKGIASKSTSKLAQQGWLKSGNCPEGTIPIRRTLKSDLVRAMSVSTMAPLTSDGASSVQQAVWAELTQPNKTTYFAGVKAHINLWNVHVDPEDQYTSSSIYVANKDHDNFINAGWHVFPKFNGDNKTRFFIYWTADGNRNTVCYNHVCKGFVQVDNTIMLGAELYPVSKYNGDQYEVRLTLNLDHEIQSWWLQYGEKLVGYWPLSLFPNFRASLVQWSGQVFKSSAGHPTITQMGSGHFPNEGLYKAAYFANAKVRVREEDYYEIGDAKTHAPKPWCYDIGRIEDGNRFLYGGPGVGPNCA